MIAIQFDTARAAEAAPALERDTRHAMIYEEIIGNARLVELQRRAAETGQEGVFAFAVEFAAQYRGALRNLAQR